MQQDNVNREARIEDKKREIYNIADQNQQATDEKNKLISELNKKNITLDELRVYLTRLKTENAQIIPDIAAKRKKQFELSQSFDRYSEKINELDKDGKMSIEEKKKKIEELRLQILDKIRQDSEIFAK